MGKILRAIQIFACLALIFVSFFQRKQIEIVNQPIREITTIHDTIRISPPATPPPQIDTIRIEKIIHDTIFVFVPTYRELSKIVNTINYPEIKIERRIIQRQRKPDVWHKVSALFIFNTLMLKYFY